MLDFLSFHILPVLQTWTDFIDYLPISFPSEDSMTFLEREHGCLIYPASDEAFAVDYTNEDIVDDEDGVVGSPLIHPKPI